MRTIERIEVFPTRLPIRQTFTFASGSAGTAGQGAPHVWVKMTDSEGAVGWGEGRPVPGWSYETLETVATTIEKYFAPAIIGLPIHDRHELHHKMHQVIGRGPSIGQPIARAALDIAVHDLSARAAGVTLREFLGGSRERRTVDLSFTVTAKSDHPARDEVQAAREAGFKHFNFKAGLGVRTDQEVSRAVRESAGEQAFVWADANQGYQLHQARAAAKYFEAMGVDVLEQPLPADQLHLMQQLRNSCTIALAVDEAIVGTSDLFHYTSRNLMDYFVMKITRSGGLWPSAQQITVAQAAGLPMLLSGLTDGMIVKVAACQLATVYGFSGPAALNGSQFTDESTLFPHKSAIEHDGAVHLNDEPGLGIAPDEDALRKYLV